MRRDYLTVQVNPDGGETGDRPPVLRISLDCPPDGVPAAIRDLDGTTLSGEDVDVALRRGDDGDGEAVLSIARRLTGEFILEANVADADIEELVAAALDRPGEARYRVRIGGADLDPIQLEKRTLLVYDPEGNLERDASLIPSGVEL